MKKSPAFSFLFTTKTFKFACILVLNGQAWLRAGGVSQHNRAVGNAAMLSRWRQEHRSRPLLAYCSLRNSEYKQEKNVHCSQRLFSHFKSKRQPGFDPFSENSNSRRKRCKGKTLLGVVNKHLNTKLPSNILPLRIKQTFPPII